MLLLPVVLPSGWCTFCDNDSDAVVRGYSGCCPYCDPAGLTAAAERRAVSAEEAEREAREEKKDVEDELATARDDLAKARRVVAEQENEIERLKTRPQPYRPMEH